MIEIDFNKVKKKNKIYISGAISGTTDYMERFEKAEKKLKDLGYDVINPAKINSFLPNDTTWEQYMEIDYKLLDICDSIYMLNGWENSKGANAELEYANLKGGYGVFYEEDEEYDEDNKIKSLEFRHIFDLGYCKFEYYKPLDEMRIVIYNSDEEVENIEFLNRKQIVELLKFINKVL